MGRDISVIAQSKLSYGNIYQLLVELSQLFNANVYYVFPSYMDLDAELVNINTLPIENPYEVSGYLISKHFLGDEFHNLVLSKEEHLYIYLWEKYGKKAGAFPQMIKHWTEDHTKNNQFIKYYLDDEYTLDIYFENCYVDVAKESFIVSNELYHGRWWDLFRILVEQQYDHLEAFLKYREKNKEIILLLGGTCAYYIDEQSPITKIGQGSQWQMSWEEIEAKLNNGKSGEMMFNIRLALTDKTYFEMIQKKLSDSPDNFCSFYDDFGEISIDWIIDVQG